MPPERNNTVRFSQLSGLAQASLTDIIPIVDTSIPTLVNKKITISGLNQSLPLYGEMNYVKSASSNWNSVYTTFNSNSGEYESTFSNIISNSSNWDSTYTNVSQNSSGWTGLTTYSTVRSLSDTWNTAYSLASSAYTSLSALSSGTWVLKAGDQMTGALTTTRTNTASFGLDEMVTKRYVDATAVATQISGNFVPSLYYTKADFQTGVPLISSVISQFNKATVGVAGSLWSGEITLNPNQFGTDVPAFVFTTANPSAGNRAGIYINSGSSGSFSYSQGTVTQDWNGPNFTTVYTLTRVGATRLSLYDDINLNGNLNVFGNASTANLVFDNWRSVLCKSVLALSGSVTTIGDRLALSGNRLAFESGTSQKLILYPSGNNGAIGWANNIGGFNTIDVYNSQDYAFSRNGNATHVVRCFGTGGQYEVIGSFPTMYTSNNSSGQGHGFTFADNLGGRIGLFPDTSNGMGIMGNMGEMAFRIYRSFTNFSNYERLSLSATRIAYEYAGTGVSRDLTIQSTGNLVLSAGNAIQLSQALPFNFVPGLSSGNAVVAYASEAFQIRTGFIGGSNYFIKDQYGHGLYSDSGGLSIRAQGSYATIGVLQATPNPIFYFEYSGTSYLAANNLGKLGIFKGAKNIYNPSATPAVSAHVSIVTDSSMNSYTSDMLLLSAGPNTSILNYINCVSAGQTIFSVNSTGSVFYNNIGATTFDSFGVVRFPADGTIIQTDGTGGRSGWNNVSVNNYAANNGNAPLASAKGQWNFPSVVNAPTAFTLNNSMYLLNDPTTTQLLGVSSNRATSGLFFYQKANGGAGAGGGSYIITVDNGDDVTHLFGGGNGKTFKIDSTSQGTCLSIRAPSNGHAFTGQVSFSPYNTNQNNIRLLQTAGQTGTFIQAVSSDNITTVFSIVSSGETNINNKIFLKPNGLIHFTNTSSTTPAIKGTSTTVQARTGDDSQYTYLQGKLQTDQAASAGTFTPDKYIILYDSTGTAYKVPVQAL